LPGPAAILRGRVENGELVKSLSITARFSDAKNLSKVEVKYRKLWEEDGHSITVMPIGDEELEGIWTR
jgi:hypothetical protein